MSLYDSTVASRQESQDLALARERLSRKTLAGQPGKAGKARQQAKPFKASEYGERNCSIVVYRPDGYWETDSFKSERIASEDAKLRKANRTWREIEQARFAQRRKAGKHRYRRHAW